MPVLRVMVSGPVQIQTRQPESTGEEHMSDYTKVVHSSNSEEWLTERTHSVGASDTLDSTSLLRKTGQLAPFEGNIHTTAGQMLEGAVLEWWCKETGRQADMCGWLLRRAESPFMHATPDGWNEEERFVVEIKTAGLNQAGKWLIFNDPPVRQTAKDTVTAYQQAVWSADRFLSPPTSYWSQVQHQLYITGFDRGYLVGLIGGKKLVWFDIDRNQEYIDKRIKSCKAFMDKVGERKQQND